MENVKQHMVISGNIYNENPPEVVLMDVQLQDMLGTEVVKKMKPLLPDSKFIMCTTYEDEEVIFEALKNGASGYLLKDESLQKIIQSILKTESLRLE